MRRLSIHIAPLLTGILIVMMLFLLALPGFAANEEIKFKIKKVTISGNKTFSDTKIKGIMVSKKSKWYRHHYYYPENFKQDLQFIVDFYNNQGFKQAGIAYYEVKLDSAREEARLSVEVFEGARTHIDDLAISGNEIISSDSLMNLVTFKPGDPFRRLELEQATKRMMRFYWDRGYLEAAITPKIVEIDTADLVQIEFKVTEGIQYTIEKIRVIGIDFTRPRIVRRKLDYDLNEVANYSKIRQSQMQLYMTGLYSSVSVDIHPATNEDSTQKSIWINIKERDNKEIQVALGYGSIEKLRGRFEATNINWLGTARKIGLITKGSFVGYSVEGFATEPWAFNSPWRWDNRIQAQYQIEPSYDVQSYTGTVSFAHSFWQQSSLTLGYQYEKAFLKNLKPTEGEIPDDVTTDISSVFQSIVFDTRDNFFNPTHGIYAETKNEFVGYFLGGTNSFTRTSYDLRFYYSSSPWTILATRVNVGLMDSPDGIGGIPLQERFYAGGPNSVRGFNYQSIGPISSNGKPKGGRLKIVWNVLEVRQSIYKMFGAVGFLDVGGIWSSPRHIDPFSMRWSPGLGLRANTFIGMMRLDLGFNPQPIHGEPLYKIYFSLGHAF